MFADVAGARAPGPRAHVHAVRQTISELRVIGTRRHGRDRHPGALLGRPADLHCATPRSTSTSWSPRARQTSFLVPGLDPRHPRRAAPASRAAPRRSSATTAASPSSCEFLAPDAAGHRHLAAAGHRHASPRPCRCSTPKGAHEPRPRSSASARSTSRVRWGTGYDTRVALVRQHHRHAQGRHPPGRLRARRCSRCCAARSSSTPVGSRSAADKLEKDDILAGLTAVRHGAAGRAAVRGADQGGARHQRRARHRGQRGREGADRAAHLDQARREAAGRAAAREGRRRDEVADSARGCTRRPSAARTRWSPRRCRPSSPTAAATDVDRTELFIVEGDTRARHRQAGPQQRVPGAAADPRQDPQRAEGVGHRHARQRRVRRRSSR